MEINEKENEKEPIKVTLEPLEFEAEIDMLGVGFAAIRGFIRPISSGAPLNPSTASVTSLSPNTDDDNKTIALTINGTGFVADMQVLVSGVSTTFTYTSATVASIPNFTTTPVGTKTIRVKKTGEFPSNGQDFTTIAVTPPSTSTVTSLSPNTDTDSKTISLTVNGTGFTASTQVLVDGGVVANTFVSATQLTVPAFATGAAGTRAVKVQNAGELPSNTVNFTTTSSSPSLPVTSGLLMWHDADDASTFTLNTSFVEQWRDKSGLNSHANASGTQRPTLESTALNGKPGLLFASSTHLMLITNGNALQKPVSYIVVIKHTGTTIRCILGSTSNQFVPRLTASHQVQLMKNQAASIGTSTSSVPTTTAQVAVTYSGTGVYQIFINGVAAGTGTNDQTFSGTPTQYFGVSGSEAYYGHIGECIKYDRVLSGAELTQIYDYLKAKWGTP